MESDEFKFVIIGKDFGFIEEKKIGEIYLTFVKDQVKILSEPFEVDTDDGAVKRGIEILNDTLQSKTEMIFSSESQKKLVQEVTNLKTKILPLSLTFDPETNDPESIEKYEDLKKNVLKLQHELTQLKKKNEFYQKYRDIFSSLPVVEISEKLCSPNNSLKRSLAETDKLAKDVNDHVQEKGYPKKHKKSDEVISQPMNVINSYFNET